MNILSVGNSFAKDTMHYAADLAKSAGLRDFKFAFLYIGGCSINRHYNNAVNNIAQYTYYVHQENDWQTTEECSIKEALDDAHWDVIVIQHGTGDKSRYTSPESYENLAPLIRYIKRQLSYDVQIAFNMAWVADPESTHHEIVSYGGNQKLMYEKVTDLTKNVVASLPEVDLILPTGTTIQNMRAYIPKPLTRDGFHLSYDLGRYAAGLTFLKTLCKIEMEQVIWAPEGVTPQEQEIAKHAVKMAAKIPYCVSPLC